MCMCNNKNKRIRSHEFERELGGMATHRMGERKKGNYVNIYHIKISKSKKELFLQNSNSRFGGINN